MIEGALSFEGLEETEVLIFGVFAGEAFDFAVFEGSELLALEALTGGAFCFVKSSWCCRRIELTFASTLICCTKFANQTNTRIGRKSGCLISKYLSRSGR